MAAACGMQEDDRGPLAEVVLDCTKRWFQDTLKEARAGDAAMQVLVGQMYRSGYGVNKNEHKVSPSFAVAPDFYGIWNKRSRLY